MFGLFKKKQLSFTAQKIMDSLSEERSWKITGTRGNPHFHNGLYTFKKSGAGYGVFVSDEGRLLYVPLKNREARTIYWQARRCWADFENQRTEKRQYEAVEIVHARAEARERARPNTPEGET